MTLLSIYISFSVTGPPTSVSNALELTIYSLCVLFNSTVHQTTCIYTIQIDSIKLARLNNIIMCELINN